MPRAIWVLNVIFLRASQSFKGPYFLIIFVNGTYKGITVVSKFAGPAGSPSVNFEGPQAMLRAIGPRARLILTPVNLPCIRYIAGGHLIVSIKFRIDLRYYAWFTLKAAFRIETIKTLGNFIGI